MAQLWGLVAIRLADATILPFDYNEYVTELTYYMKSLEEKYKEKNIKLTHLEDAIHKLEKAAHYIHSQSPDHPHSINEKLMMAEREFLSVDGIPSRPWYKHMICAPGLWSGYGADTLPTISEALESEPFDMKSVKKAERQVARRILAVAKVLQS